MTEQAASMTAQNAGVIAEFLPLLTSFVVDEGEYGIALGGAHAKGTHDAASDLDLYVFARQVRGTAERDRLCTEWSADVRTVTCWDDGSPSFVQGGADFYYQGQKVECWLRNVDYIDGVIAECRRGVVRQSIVTWTVMGFYNHCTLSDLHNMVPVADPRGLLARWQRAVAEYPPRLREAIIGRHLGAAKFWPRNFHYRSAIERGDVLYTQAIVNQVAHNLIQVLFALNEVYFPGDKKLEPALAHLPLQPASFGARVRRMMLPERPADRAFLDWQREELSALVDEVEALCS